MGSSGSKRVYYPAPPPPNPNPIGVGESKSTYNVPTVGNFSSGNEYQPFFTQSAFNPVAGQAQSYFNTYGSRDTEVPVWKDNRAEQAYNFDKISKFVHGAGTSMRLPYLG